MAYNYFKEKEQNKKMAKIHTEWVDKYLSAETQYTIDNTIFIGENSELAITDRSNKNQAFKSFPNISCINTDTVSAIFDYYGSNNSDKNLVTVLNFASFKNPGGMFIEGSMAQEEALCHRSNLYNVLVGVEEQRNHFYYAKNRKKTNFALYFNRALLSPLIIFGNDDYFENRAYANVITCAAPNVKSYFRYYNNPNAQVIAFNILNERIRFIIRIAATYGCENLILGAFGCGVFGNDPELVAKCFLDAIDEYSNSFKNIIFAVPSGFKNNNYEVFFNAVMHWNINNTSQRR